ncbi:hypothetical protein [Microcoleus sp. AT9b-C3]|uniref:hypothetical protein n=1 Tax=Microcoleus sp. AT9b-C3 TaxID=2818629 RepID=UPI002FD364B7
MSIDRKIFVADTLSYCQAAGRYGLKIGELSEIIETALNGRVVSQVLEVQGSAAKTTAAVPVVRRTAVKAARVNRFV